MKEFNFIETVFTIITIIFCINFLAGLMYKKVLICVAHNLRFFLRILPLNEY